MSRARTLQLLVILALIFVVIANNAHAQSVTGDWSGHWHSNANDHSGKISATFCQTSANSMQANFRGTFAKVIPFRYRTQLNIVSQQPGLTVMSGGRRLPLGGQFNYFVTMTDQCFNGSFSSRRNRGTFVMRRQ